MLDRPSQEPRRSTALLKTVLSTVGVVLFVILTAIVWRQSRFLLRPDTTSATVDLGSSTIYERRISNSPIPNVIHIITVDVDPSTTSIFVTPPDSGINRHFKARTTSEAVEEFDLLFAVNGSPFEPFHSKHALDFYPRSGDPVDAQGHCAANGSYYSQTYDELPVLAWENNQATVTFQPTASADWAISGKHMLISNGQIQIAPVKSTDGERHPRTAVGFNQANERWWFVVIDGRQEDYSLGLTVKELAVLMLELGAWEAINLDGGGSSAMAVKIAGKPTLMNAPFHTRIPVRERPVANHLGIKIE